MAKTIKIKRSGDVFQSEREAIAYLSRIPHQPGQPVLVRYRISETETDAILAIGTRTGSGPGTYTISSVGGVRVIPGIIRSESELPDASTLVNGELWLYQEPVTSNLYWIYLHEDQRIVTYVDPSINYRVFCLSDNSEYWLCGGTIEKANNYYSREAIDQKIAETTWNIDQGIEELSEQIVSGLQSISESLGVSSGYTGTVQGASNFDDADRILQSRIEQTTQTIRGLSNRVSDLEKELISDTEGMTPVTRLDTLYSWYDEVTHTPSDSIEFVKPSVQLIQGSTVQVKVIYRWSWADRKSLFGLRLNNEIKPFGVNDVAYANIPSGYYEWRANVLLTDTPVTLEASFEGSSEDPVTLTLEPEPIQRNIQISWPDPSWGSGQFTYSVNFEGSGLPSDWAGNELAVWQRGSKVFQTAEGQGPLQSSSYTGVLNPGFPEIPVRATWNNVITEATFRPTWLIVLPRNTEITTGSLEGSNQTWVSYQETIFMETPEITYSPDQTLVLLSYLDFEDFNVICVSGQSEPLTVTSDFTSPGTIEYHGATYNYISFQGIGAGTFKFIIT